MKLPHSPWEAEEGVATTARGQGHPTSHCLPAPLPGVGTTGFSPLPWGRSWGRDKSRPRSSEGGRPAGSWAGTGHSTGLRCGHGLAQSWVGMGQWVGMGHRSLWNMGRHGPRAGMLEHPALAGSGKQGGELGFRLAHEALQDQPGWGRRGGGTPQHPGVSLHPGTAANAAALQGTQGTPGDPGGSFSRVGHEDTNPPPVLATTPCPATGRGFMVATHVAVLA